MDCNQVDQAAKSDVFKILVATDCHLGFAEKDAIRGNDTFVTFEEILSIAREREVDIILLGGDLFHQNKPSRNTFHKCLHLLRTYCMGDKPIEIEFLSDQSENFKHSVNPVVNYEDPNMNIAIPIFSIHGNHDDPAGPGNLCALDLLSVTGLINYFGKCTDLENIQMSPLLMQKGKTKLALYGLGSIRDERLHRLFREGKVSMVRPREQSDTWFNLFVIHQNRVKHGPTNYIPEQYLDDFLDLIIWGHEHECRINLEENPTQCFFVSQPGSSVATSLCPGEAIQKHVGFLEIYKKTPKMTSIPLQTVRQFYTEDISLPDTGLDPTDSDIANTVFEYCKKRVYSLLERAELEHTGNSKQPRKPLIRLRVQYTDQFEIFNVQRFGQQFVDKVANPKDIVHFHRKKSENKMKDVNVDLDCLDNVLRPEVLDKSRVEDLVKEYFQKADEKSQLLLLSENGLGAAVHEFVEKDAKEAIEDLVSHQVTKVQTHLYSKSDLSNHIDDEIYKYKKERLKSQESVKEVALVLEGSRNKSSKSLPVGEVVISDDDAEAVDTSIASKCGKGIGRGRSRGRGRASNQQNLSTSRRGRAIGGKKEIKNTLKNSCQYISTNKSDYNSDKFSRIHKINNMEEKVSKKRKVASYEQVISSDSTDEVDDNPF